MQRSFTSAGHIHGHMTTPELEPHTISIGVKTLDHYCCNKHHAPMYNGCFMWETRNGADLNPKPSEMISPVGYSTYIKRTTAELVPRFSI